MEEREEGGRLREEQEEGPGREGRRKRERKHYFLVKFSLHRMHSMGQREKLKCSPCTLPLVSVPGSLLKKRGEERAW